MSFLNQLYKKETSSRAAKLGSMGGGERSNEIVEVGGRDRPDRVMMVGEVLSAS